MKLLAIETSTEACSAALSIEGEIFECFEIAPQRHTDLILGMIDQLLATANIRLNHLDVIAVGNGPGSFMGTRLAVGVAQGLAFGAGLPVVAISSLQALAQRAFRQFNYSHIAAAWDARMGEIYWGVYQQVDDFMLPMDQEHLSAPALIELPDGMVWSLVGNAWQVYQTDLPAKLRIESHLLHPSAIAVIELAAYYYSKGGAVLPEQLEPQYLRQRVAFKRSFDR